MVRGTIQLLYTTTLVVIWWDLLHGHACWAWIVLTLGLFLIFMRMLFGTRIAEKLLAGVARNGGDRLPGRPWLR
jgi:hypothetical protein